MDNNEVRESSLAIATPTLRAIANYYNDNGWWPSNRDLVELTKLSSTSSVRHHLRILERAGLLITGANKGRAMTITDNGWDVLNDTQVVQGERA